MINYMIILTLLLSANLVVLLMILFKDTPIPVIKRDHYDEFVMNELLRRIRDESYYANQHLERLARIQHSLVNIHYILGVVHRKELLEFKQRKENRRVE